MEGQNKSEGKEWTYAKDILKLKLQQYKSHKDVHSQQQLLFRRSLLMDIEI